MPPSAPSTVIKSRYCRFSTMALTIAANSQGWPMHSLMPTGLPPANSLSRSAKSSRPAGVENSEWLDGDTQSSPAVTPRVSAISWVTFGASNIPPCPGLAP